MLELVERGAVTRLRTAMALVPVLTENPQQQEVSQGILGVSNGPDHLGCSLQMQINRSIHSGYQVLQ